MRILLVTTTNDLVKKLTILNPKLEYCAIVTDDVESAKKVLKNVGLSKNLIQPFYALKECIKDLRYDYCFCIENSWWDLAFTNKSKKYGVSQDKLISFCDLVSPVNFLLERSLRYFKKHAAEFEIFATGISHVEKALDVTCFKHKTFNFGRGSQDLYYNLQVAKFAISCGGGHNKTIRYALIGLAPYSFHYDLSKSANNQFLMLQHFIAFKDLHNFHLPTEVYKNFFHKGYLAQKFSLDSMDVNNPYFAKFGEARHISPQARLEARDIIDTWSEKVFPETCEENIGILDEYLTLCEANNIRPLVFLAPMTEAYIKYYNRQRLEEFYSLVEQIINRHHLAIFIDGWRVKFLSDADFYDVEHLNIEGAAKFSFFLNGIVEHLEGR